MPVQAFVRRSLSNRRRLGKISRGGLMPNPTSARVFVSYSRKDGLRQQASYTGLEVGARSKMSLVVRARCRRHCATSSFGCCL
jgi:hypothetical protein